MITVIMNLIFYIFKLHNQFAFIIIELVDQCKYIDAVNIQKFILDFLGNGKLIGLVDFDNFFLDIFDFGFQFINQL